MHLTPVTLELGGKSPCIIDHTADLRTAARRLVFGKYLNCGQTCVAPDYVLVDAQVQRELLACICREIRKQYGEQPLQNDAYGKMINRKHFDRVLGQKKMRSCRKRYLDRFCRFCRLLPWRRLMHL